MKGLKIRRRNKTLNIILKNHLCPLTCDLYNALKVLPQQIEHCQEAHFKLNCYGTYGFDQLLSVLREEGLPMNATINGICANTGLHISNCCEEVAIVKGSRVFSRGEWLTDVEAIEEGLATHLDTTTPLAEPAWLWQEYLKTSDQLDWEDMQVKNLDTVRDIERYLRFGKGLSRNESKHIISIIKAA